MGKVLKYLAATKFFGRSRPYQEKIIKQRFSSWSSPITYRTAEAIKEAMSHIIFDISELDSAAFSEWDVLLIPFGERVLIVDALNKWTFDVSIDKFEETIKQVYTCLNCGLIHANFRLFVP